MVLFVNGKRQTELSVDDIGKNLVLASLPENEAELETIGVPRAVLDDHKASRVGRYENRDGYDYIIVHEAKAGREKGRREMLVYFRKKLLVFAFADRGQYDEVVAKIGEALDANDLSMTLARFFDRLTHSDTEMLQEIEEEIAGLEERIVEGDNSKEVNREIGRLRRTLLRFKSYYEQLLDTFSDMMENENSLFSAAAMKYTKILADKLDRTYRSMLTLQDFLTQVREEYQTQIDISLNATMKVFTVITSVFLPLTLVVGWYGMNVKMPEFEWQYGYLFVIALSIVITAITLLIFKKKKWF